MQRHGSLPSCPIWACSVVMQWHGSLPSCPIWACSVVVQGHGSLPSCPMWACSVVVQRHGSLPSCPMWACSVVVQGHGSLPSCPMWACSVVVQRHGSLPSCPIWARSRVKSGTTGVQTLRLAYIWKHCMDLFHSKFYGIVWSCIIATLWLFAHLPHMDLLLGQKLVKSDNGPVWNCSSFWLVGPVVMGCSFSDL